MQNDNYTPKEFWPFVLFGGFGAFLVYAAGHRIGLPEWATGSLQMFAIAIMTVTMIRKHDRRVGLPALSRGRTILFIAGLPACWLAFHFLFY